MENSNNIEDNQNYDVYGLKETFEDAKQIVNNEIENSTERELLLKTLDVLYNGYIN